MAPPRLAPPATGSPLDRLGRYAFAGRFVVGKRVLDLNPGAGTELLRRAGAVLPDTGGPFDVVIAFDMPSAPPVSRLRELVGPDGLLLIAWPEDAAARAALEQNLNAAFAHRVVVPVRLLFATVAGGEDVSGADAADAGPDCHVALCSAAPVSVPPADRTVAVPEVAAYLETEARAWRAVADDRDQALEEVERINSFLDRRIGEQAQEIDQLQRARRELEAQLHQVLPLSLRGRVTRKLRALFPQQTLTGRALRGGLHLARRLLKRSA